MIAYITHPDCALHETGQGHPEAVQRLAAIEDRLIASGLSSLLERYEAPLASDEALLTVHAPEYLERIRQALPGDDGLCSLDEAGETILSKHSLQAARRAAGAALLAVDRVMAGPVRQAFCCTRPPGHHARYAEAAGFCLFNNVALAAHRAIHHHGVDRVAVVDFDVHHGDGTESLLAGEPRVLFCSLFQEGLYPFVEGEPHCRRIGYPPLTAGRVFRARYEAVCSPALERFEPQLLILSAGFDGHHEDVVSSTLLRESDFAWVTERLREQADRSASSRIVSCLEGGYALSALGRCVSRHLNALFGHAH